MKVPVGKGLTNHPLASVARSAEYWERKCSPVRGLVFPINETNKLREAYTANNIGRKGAVSLKHWNRSERAVLSDEIGSEIEVNMDQLLMVRL